MFAVNYTGLRENMKMYLDRVTDDYEPMMVTRKNNKNVVVLSEGAYNNLMENVYLLGNKANYDWLMESKRQLEAGDAHTHLSPFHSKLNKKNADRSAQSAAIVESGID